MADQDFDSELKALDKAEAEIKARRGALYAQKTQQSREAVLTPKNLQEAEWELAFEYEKGNALLATCGLPQTVKEQVPEDREVRLEDGVSLVNKHEEYHLWDKYFVVADTPERLAQFVCDWGLTIRTGNLDEMYDEWEAKVQQLRKIGVKYTKPLAAD